MDPYKVLNVSKNASSDEIKKSYYKLSLIYHPDRAEQGSHERFIEIGRAFEILSNMEKRKLYDSFGVTDDASSVKSKNYKDMFTQVTEDDIENFKSVYVNSAEELEDIYAAYLEFKGSLQCVGESVFFGDIKSEARYKLIIQRAIDRKILPALGDFLDFTKYERKIKTRVKKANKEAEEAASLAKELKVESEESLKALITLNNEKRSSFIDDLEAKYSVKKRAKAQ